MAKTKNYHVHGSDAYIAGLKEEYDFIGRYSRVVEPGHLVLFAVDPRKREDEEKKQEKAKKEKVSRKNTYRPSK